MTWSQLVLIILRKSTIENKYKQLETELDKSFAITLHIYWSKIFHSKIKEAN